MCGICGAVSFRGTPPRRPDIERMCRAMIHRGPDDQGVFVDGTAGLGMRRLSIIDLVTGHQPIHNEDETVWVIQNGEVYNFPELREQLTAAGHRFYTRTDTEVIVHLYEEHGLDFVDKMNGMFGLAIWDIGRQRLVLARDRMGEKPLHYAQADKGLVFGSELKSLLEHPAVGRSLNLEAMDMYLTMEYVPAPHSIYRGVKKLLPGEMLVFSRAGLDLRQYWDIEFVHKMGRRNEEELAVELRDHLRDAVRRRLIADVPLGVFLSGGIDSSAVAALARESSTEQVKTFSVAFTEKSFDESDFARRVAKRLGTDHHELTLSPDVLLDVVPEVAFFLDEPLGDASIIPTYVLSRFTRRHVKVALGGDGGDELFAGYPTYQAYRLARTYLALPKALRRGLVERLVMRMPVSTDNISLDFQAKRFISALEYPPATRNLLWMGSFSPEQKEALLVPDVRAELREHDTFEPVHRHMANCRATNELEKLLYLDSKMYLQDDVLVKVDRASMANSLEVRAPFLDHLLVDFVASLPIEMKLRRMTTKFLLKQAMRSYLPKGIVDRPKKGFGIPVAEWLKKDLRPFVLDVFDRDRLRRGGLFDPDYVHLLLKQHFDGTADHRKVLWTLLVFEMWKQQWLPA